MKLHFFKFGVSFTIWKPFCHYVTSNGDSENLPLKNKKYKSLARDGNNYYNNLMAKKFVNKTLL